MNLRLRVISGVVLGGLLAAAVWVGGAAFDLLLAAAVLAGTRELELLARRVGPAPLPWLLYPLTSWLAFRFLLPVRIQPLELGLGTAVVAGLGACLLGRLGLGRWAISVGAALYLGLTLGYFPGLLVWRPHDAHYGARLLTLTLLAIAACDIAAYAAGTTAGRHRLVPAISPRKTVEGAVAGLAASALVATALSPPLIGAAVPAGLALGVVVAVAAQAGDLVESALKREAQVKDSGVLVPGHGGLLDRVDSLLFVGPAVYGLLLLLGIR